MFGVRLVSIIPIGDAPAVSVVHGVAQKLEDPAG